MSKIDVHHHYYPPFFVEALERAGGDPSGWFIPKWTIEADKRLAKAVGVQTTILSLTAPGPCIEKDSASAARLARQVNDYAATLRDAEPAKSSLGEIAYALDDLKADGITLFTRYGPDNHYLGHADFRPIWAELNRRKAVVFVHPTHPVDTNLVNKHLPQPMFDYPHETGRAAMDLIIGNTIRSFPDCKIILSHAGGTLPYLIYRPAGMLPHTPMDIGKSTEEIVEEARTFYYDTAISANPLTLQLLFAFAKPGHVLFGTDFPNAPTEAIQYFTANLDRYDAESDIRREVESEGALKLLPRLSGLLKDN